MARKNTNKDRGRATLEQALEIFSGTTQTEKVIDSIRYEIELYFEYRFGLFERLDRNIDVVIDTTDKNYWRITLAATTPTGEEVLTEELAKIGINRALSDIEDPIVAIKHSNSPYTLEFCFSTLNHMFGSGFIYSPYMPLQITIAHSVKEEE